MTVPVLILRPGASAQQTAERAAQLGLEPLVEPLFEIAPITWTVPSSDEFDALLLTSANAVHFGGSSLGNLKSLPVLAVGKTTAKAADQAGFEVVKTGQGGAKSLLEELDADQYRRILWLRALDHMKLAITGIEITGMEVYRSRQLNLSEATQRRLQSETVVLLHSVRAARVFAEETKRYGLDRAYAHIVALSEQIAKSAGNGWKTVQSADQPTDQALLSLASALCLGGKTGVS